MEHQNLIPVTDHHSGTINTFVGRKFNYQNPTPEMIYIVDIAKGLSNECRFAGQIISFYSVAQHSVAISYMVPDYLAKEALLHDAAEAYYKDIPKPLKMLIGDQYQQMSKRCDTAISKAFQLKHSLDDPLIKEADKKALIIEHDYFFKRRFDSKNEDNNIMTIIPLLPIDAYDLFMNRYFELFMF